jgi:hypothetical protein
MAAAELHVTYTPDEDGTGELIATVRSGVFSARGSGCFGGDVKSFLANLRTYPLSSEHPPMIQGSSWEGRAGCGECYLRIIVEPYNSRGTLLVHVDVGVGVWTTSDTDPQSSATIRFLTEYAAIDSFAAELEEVLDSRRDVAVLKGIPD